MIKVLDNRLLSCTQIVVELSKIALFRINEVVLLRITVSYKYEFPQYAQTQNTRRGTVNWDDIEVIKTY